MKPPFKPERAYTNLMYPDGHEETTAYVQPSIREYVSDMLYGPQHFEKAYQAQESYRYLIVLLHKLKVLKP